MPSSPGDPPFNSGTGWYEFVTPGERATTQPKPTRYSMPERADDHLICTCPPCTCWGPWLDGDGQHMTGCQVLRTAPDPACPHHGG
jgi:hypothetical protein